jgi:hypothetical protein
MPDPAGRELGMTARTGYLILRELHRLGRLKRTYWLRVLCVALPVICLLPLFLEDRLESGRLAFIVLAAVHLAVVTLLAPAATANWLSEEEANRTLGLIFTTPLTSTALVASQSVSRLVDILLHTFSVLPIYVGLMLFGGITVGEVAWVLALILATGFFAGSVGLFVAVLWPRLRFAMIGAYAFLFLLWYLLPLALAGIEYLLGSPRPGTELRWAYSLIGNTNPFASYVQAMAGGPVLGLPDCSYAPGGLALFAVALLFVGSQRLRGAVLGVPIWGGRRRKSAKSSSESAPPLPARNELGDGNPVAWLWLRGILKTRARAALYDTMLVLFAGMALFVSWAPYLRYSRSGFRSTVQSLLEITGVGTIAVAFLVIGANVWPRVRNGLLAFGLLLITLLVIYLQFVVGGEMRSDWSQMEGYFGLGGYFWGFAALVALQQGAEAFVKERRSGAFASLLTSTLTNREIIHGKLEGMMRLYGPFVLIFIPCWTIPALMYPLKDSFLFEDEASFMWMAMAVMGPFLMCGAVLAVALLAMRLSLRSPSMTYALVSSLIALAVIGVAQLVIAVVLLFVLVPFVMFTTTGKVVYLVLAGFGPLLAVGFIVYRWMVANLRARQTP